MRTSASMTSTGLPVLAVTWRRRYVAVRGAELTVLATTACRSTPPSTCRPPPIETLLTKLLNTVPVVAGSNAN
eukprot:458162-Pyramimonas_sp.AAC.1